MITRPVSWYKLLELPKHRRQYGYFIIEGRRAVAQVLAHHRDWIEELICTSEAAPDYALESIPIRRVTYGAMKSICLAETPQGVAALMRIPPDTYTSKMPDSSLNTSAGTGNASGRILLLEHIQNPGNAGTLIRSAAAFGFDGVIMSDQCADPFSPKTAQSSAGSLFSVWMRRTNDYMLLIPELKNSGYKLIGADLGGSDLCDFGDLCGSGLYILALGNEGSGLSGELLGECDYRFRIPISKSGAESLNVGVSGGIFMYMLSNLRLT